MNGNFWLAAAAAFLVMASGLAAPVSAQRGGARARAEAEAQAQAAAEAQQQAEERQYTLPELREMAKEAYETGDARKSEFALTRWSALEPQRFDVRLELGSALTTLRKYSEAIAVLKTASSMIPSDEAPHRLLAKIYEAQGADSLRAMHLITAARLAPRNFENQYNLGRYYASIGREKEAEQLFLKAMELNGAFAPAKFEYAKIMYGRGDLEEAFSKFGEAIFADPANALYHARYAHTASLTKRWSTARESIAEALKLAPNNLEVLCLASNVYLNDGNNAAAERHARTALRLSPNSMRALEALGDVFAADFKYREACGAYMTVWQKAGYREDLAFKLGASFALDGKWKEAQTLFESVVSKKPNHGEALYKLTETYCELGNLRQANATLALGNFKNSRSNRAWYKAAQARVLEAQDKPEQALAMYREAFGIDEFNPHVNAALGKYYHAAGALDSALLFLQTAARYEPQNIRHMQKLARVQEAKGDLDDAVATYERILARNPSYIEMYTAMALISENRKDPQRAITYLNRGLRYSPKDSGMLFKLGGLYQTTRQYDLAINTYQQAIGNERRANQQTMDALKTIGEIYYTKLQDEKKALAFFRRFIRAGGKDTGVEFLVRRLTSKEG